MLEYRNRIGKVYYLRESVTKTGKPRYFFTQKKEGKGELVDTLPEGYEIYERLEEGQVFLRKQQARMFLEEETALIKDLLTDKSMSFHYMHQQNGRYLTIYESSQSSLLIDEIMAHAINVLKKPEDIAAKMARIGRFTAVLRFRVEEAGARGFTAERFCFLGGIDDWIFLEQSGSLEKLAEKYIRLLGTDKFYSPFNIY